MLDNKIKVRLINHLEESLQIHLLPEQLEFLFSNKTLTTYTGPRRSGKDTLTAIKIAISLLESIDNNKHIGVVTSSKETYRMFYEKLIEIINTLMPGMITRTFRNPNRINLVNGSVVSIFVLDNNMRGHKLDEAYVIEFYCIREFKNVYMTLLATMLHKQDYKINLIGTPALMGNRFISELLIERRGSKHISVSAR